jgi:hypothetical protein
MPFDAQNEFPEYIGAGSEEFSKLGLSTRMKYGKGDGGIFQVGVNSHDYSVNGNRSDIFAPYSTQNVPSNGSSRTGDTRFGYGKGRRHRVLIAADVDFIVKVNSKLAKPLRWQASTLSLPPLELIISEVHDLFFRASSGVDAQVQVIDTVAASALSGGEYFKLPATNSTFQDKVFGIYIVKDGVGDEPTDSDVSDWVSLAIVAADTNANVATKLDTLLGTSPFSGYLTSGVASNNVTVTHAVTGAMTNASDGTSGTGFTFNTPSTNGAASAALNIDLLMDI